MCVWYGQILHQRLWFSNNCKICFRSAEHLRVFQLAKQLKSVHRTKSSHNSWNFIPLREILPDWYRVPCSIWFCLFLPWTFSVTFWKHECRLCQLLSKHLLHDHGLRFKSLTCRSLQFTVILIIMSHECVCVCVCASVYDFRHDHHKFVYGISQRMDCLGGVVSHVDVNFCMGGAGGLDTMGHDLPWAVHLVMTAQRNYFVSQSVSWETKRVHKFSIWGPRLVLQNIKFIEITRIHFLNRTKRLCVVLCCLIMARRSGRNM